MPSVGKTMRVEICGIYTLKTDSIPDISSFYLAVPNRTTFRKRNKSPEAFDFYAVVMKKKSPENANIETLGKFNVPWGVLE
jgi:hypothetical protein